MFVSDIDESLAPMRIIPRSHKKYYQINKTLSKLYKNHQNLIMFLK